jgi:hypothetical protein
MIDQLSVELFNNISSITELNGRIGYVLGGKEDDPDLKNIPIPSAWVLFSGEEPSENKPSVIPKSLFLNTHFSVLVYIPYNDQTDLINNQYILLEKIKKSVHGKNSVSGHRWYYEGSILRMIHFDRQGFELRFSIQQVLNS